MSSCCTPPNNGANKVDQGGDCCAVPTTNGAPTSAGQALNCPICGTKGKAVDNQTLKAMLAVNLEAVRPVDYRFCRSEGCPVVYFATDGRQTFIEANLRERVYQKHPMGEDVFVCYCFRHTPDAIYAGLMATGASTAIKKISTGIKAGQCAVRSVILRVIVAWAM